MLNYFNTFLSFAQPMATEAAISQANSVAKKMGMDERFADVATDAVRLAYKGPEKLLAKTVATKPGQVVANKLQECLGDSYDEPTLVSNAISRLAGLGGFFLTGGGFWGSAASTFITKSVEPLVRKAEHDADMRYYEKLDREMDARAQEQYETNGFGGFGF